MAPVAGRIRGGGADGTLRVRPVAVHQQGYRARHRHRRRSEHLVRDPLEETQQNRLVQVALEVDDEQVGGGGLLHTRQLAHEKLADLPGKPHEVALAAEVGPQLPGIDTDADLNIWLETP